MEKKESLQKITSNVAHYKKIVMNLFFQLKKYENFKN